MLEVTTSCGGEVDVRQSVSRRWEGGGFKVLVISKAHSLTADLPRCPKSVMRGMLHLNMGKITPFQTANIGPAIARCDFQGSATYR